MTEHAPNSEALATGFEVPTPILNSPYDEPAEHWFLQEGEPAQRLPGRRAAGYFYRDPNAQPVDGMDNPRGVWMPLPLVNDIRARVKEWRATHYRGASRVTQDLLNYWRRDGRKQRLFFAQLEAAETIIFFTEARADFLQGISVPPDEPSPDRQAEGCRAFRRYACKMATGTGKTTVMGMLAAWSILNKVNDRGNAQFSDTVLVVCPNVTIRNRLDELDPRRGEASLYRTRDLVPADLMPDLARGRVLITNWHVFEPQAPAVGEVSARVLRTGEPRVARERIHIGDKNTTARGKRYLTLEEFNRQVDAGVLTVTKEQLDEQGNLRWARVEWVRYEESDTALVNRVLGREVGGKQNILVFNDEAHHAYRIGRPEADDDEDGEDGAEPDDFLDDDEAAEGFYKEATVWVDGLDKIHKARGINYCVDLSATPYYLGRVAQATNTTFPWVVSDFGLTDAIESGLVKIPQFAVRDTTGTAIPGYFNVWRWVMEKLNPAERGGRKGSAKPEAILKWASTPIAMLGGLWQELFEAWQQHSQDPRPPVFIVVCKNTRLAKVIYDWLALEAPPSGIAPAGIAGLRNSGDETRTIRVDTKVVQETDTGQAKSDEARWMRLTLDTVGRREWPPDGQGRPIYPPDFEELAAKLKRPLHPPGRDTRCIVSVGMLTEGWDCNTVTHIVGLRPFMSQLLCEQVVGRGLRRASYEIGPDGRLTEEVSRIFGVPFEIIPFKANAKGGPVAPPVKRFHVRAIPEKARYEIRFPRVEGYRQSIHSRLRVDWDHIAPLDLDPSNIPIEVEMAAMLPINGNRPSLYGPGRLVSVDLNPYRRGRRFQELVFELARDLTRAWTSKAEGEAPAHVLFPQVARVAERYLREKVRPIGPADVLDVFLAPYYGWVIDRLADAIRPDVAAGEAPELPRYEQNRGPGSTADVDLWTTRDAREVVKCHLNYMVPDTHRWEQTAAYYLDTHPRVEAWVKNAGLGLAIPYLNDGAMHDYIPDFVIRLAGLKDRYLLLETKGYDPLVDVKTQAAQRWVSAVNAEGSFGQWAYGVAKRPEQTRELIDQAALAFASLARPTIA